MTLQPDPRASAMYAMHVPIRPPAAVFRGVPQINDAGVGGQGELPWLPFPMLAKACK
jgi:hypothetical protein